MALPDLTGQNIENTYQRVLQTDGTVIYDGTGSVFFPVSASYAVTASYAEYAVSASHEIIKEVSSSYADYAKESGLSTSSISASYAITASYALNSPDIFPYTGSAVISGSLEVTGDITGSGKIDLNDGSNNVLISTDNNTITTSNTVAVGYQALTNLTTGIGNTALGYQAGISLTTSNGNTVIGFEAGSSHSSHSTSVTAIGYQAGKSTTLGGIFIGNQAGINVNNSSNILIGDLAGSTITSGNGNIGIGNSSLRSATLQNIGIGSDAGRYGAGSYSVLIGHQAGRGSSGNPVNQTTLLGYRANYLGNGNNDVMVGRNAGLLLTSSNGNILIGDNVASTETSLNNKLYIENSNSTTPLIYGEFDNDLVRINGKLFVSNSLDITGSVSASTYYGDGSNLTGISSDPFPYTGSAVISGSLEVIGDITGSGKISLDYLNGTHTVIGNEAGSVLSSGNGSTFVGYQAGKSSTGPTDGQTLIGAFAGNGLTSGAPGAVMVGYNTDGKTNGSWMVGIGNSAYVRNSAGVAIGSSTRAGFYDVSMGYQTGRNASTSYAISIGRNTGNNAGGGYHVLIGDQSGYNISGTGNITLGRDSGFNLGGIYNTSLGYKSGYNTVGDHNITLGTDSGYNASGSNNILLGYQAGYNLTGSNQLIIANNSSSALVTGDFANNTFNISGSVSASTYYGDGSNLTSLPTQDPFPYTGSAIISGSLEVTGSITVTSDISGTGSTLKVSEIASSIGAASGAGEKGLNAETVTFYSTTVIAGEVYYLGSSAWTLSAANAESTSKGFMGVATSTNSNTGMVIGGIVYLFQDPGGSVGDIVYLSTATGRLTTTAPTATGDVVRVMGYKVGTNLVFFDPSNDYIELS